MSLSLTNSRRAVSVGGQEVPVNDIGQMLINFRDRPDFPTYSAADIIDIGPAAGFARQDRAGCVAARGLVIESPRRYARAGSGSPRKCNRQSGRRRFYLPFAAQRAAFPRAVVLGLTVCFGFAFLNERRSAALTALLALGYLALAHLTWAYSGLVIDIVFPLLTLGVTYTGLAGYRYATEEAEKRRLRLAFEHYLHPKVIESILDRPGTVKLGGEVRHLSILFADIVNYTARAERENPEDLVALLNAYLTKMTDLIMEGGGVVDKIRGDGIMAFWGAPITVPNPSRLAVDCALAMLEELHSLRSHDARFIDIDIGIGVATGEAVVGNFGGERRFDYSAIGDTVNLASRFESLTRQVKAHLLVTEATFIEANGPYIAREVGLVKVKGKSHAVQMIEIAGCMGDGIDPGFYDSFAQAVMLVRKGQNARSPLGSRAAIERKTFRSHHTNVPGALALAFWGVGEGRAYF